eukprot:10677952-Heterocapsa_arctica.AAC.1
MAVRRAGSHKAITTRCDASIDVRGGSMRRSDRSDPPPRRARENLEPFGRRLRRRRPSTMTMRRWQPRSR